MPIPQRPVIRPQSSLRLAFWLLTSLAPSLLPTAAFSQQYSELWGKTGERWSHQDSRLKDFSHVGYTSGDAIPDWPVGVDVTDFGAVPNDDIDDSQAFKDAIAASPDKRAVFVPSGRYTILQQIQPKRDYFVLRGEDMYGTVLFFPKNLNEIYVQEVGYDSDKPKARHTGHPKGFFRVEGGTHRSIENLTFEFREQPKMGHWEHKGADAIHYGDGVVDSWVRNIYVKNADHGVMMTGATRISFLNMIFDHYSGRPDTIGSGGKVRWVGHIGINMGGAKDSLFHNIEFKGKYFHDFDIISVPSNNVVSNVKGSNMSLHHHGQGARHNLYTNVNVGTGERSLGGLKDSQRQVEETHWRIFGAQTLDPATVPMGTQKGHVFVGYDAGLEESINDAPGIYYEAIDPAQLHPQNIYLAQLEYFGKPLPEGPPPQPPLQSKSDVVVLNPTDDNKTSAKNPDSVEDPENNTLPFGSYFKFDLSDLDLDSIERARLRINAVTVRNTPITLGLASVDDDSWTQSTLTHSDRPVSGAIQDTVEIDSEVQEKWFEFDVTSFVQNEWGGDKVVSFYLSKTSGGGYNGYLRSRENGNAPELVIEQVPSPVPGPPTAPKGGQARGLIGNIRLDWEDSPEADVTTYNVYRSNKSGGFDSYGAPIAMGLVSSEYLDMDSVGNWAVGMMKSSENYYYRITAVDSHGYESEPSAEITGTPLAPAK